MYEIRVIITCYGYFVFWFTIITRVKENFEDKFERRLTGDVVLMTLSQKPTSLSKSSFPFDMGYSLDNDKKI